MASIAFAPLSRAPGWAARHPLQACALLFLGAALILRSAWLGDPIAGYDEQFYLVAGDHLARGGLPYVEVWDRKPFGLFAIYAAATRIAGGSVLGYQLAAALFAAATALSIALIARRSHAWRASAMAGLVYLVWLMVMGGQDGQSPVFYNLFIAGAALLVLRAGDGIAGRGGIAKAMFAMLLCGLAIQIKPTVVFESAFLGCALLLAGWRAGLPPAVQGLRAASYVTIGLLPSLLVAGFYWSQGAFDAFWYANVESAMARHDGWTGAALVQLGAALLSLAPVAILAVLGRIRAFGGGAAREDAFLACWLGAATIGFLSVGYFYHHYALPLLVPMALATARFFDRSRLAGFALAMLCLPPAFTATVLERQRLANDKAQIAAIAAAIPAAVRERCMLIYEGPPVLYHLTRACTVTPFLFPDHLFSAREGPAIGRDQSRVLADALARRPEIIVIDGNPAWHIRNAANDAMIARALRRDYRRIARLPFRYYFDPAHALEVWQRVG